MSTNIRLLNAQAVRELLPLDRCIPLMRHAMALVVQSSTRQPIRQVLAQPDGRGMLGVMPGYVDNPSWLGIKVVAVFPGNFGTELGSHQGMVLLFDPHNGTPRAIVDARELTAIRTSAASAVATDVLAPKNVRTLGLFGYGEQAHKHALALTRVREFTQILVWGRNSERSKAFAADLREELPCEIRAVDKPEEAAEADVVCTITAASEPFYRAGWLRPGQHLNLVGSSIPSTSEVEPGVVQRARYFADNTESARVLAGEFQRAKSAGLVNDEHIIGSIGDVLEGRVPGRTDDLQITLFKSLGMVVEDLIAADHVFAEATRKDVGPLVQW